MALTNKQKSFIKNNLTNDIIEACEGGNKDNVVKFTVISDRKQKKEQVDDIHERHAFLLKRQTLWEIVQKGMEIVDLGSGHKEMIDPLAAIEAIAELNRMDGHYAPEKFEHTYIVSFADEENAQ